MGTFGLIARGGIRKWLTAIEAKSIAIARVCIWDNARKVSVLYSLEHMTRSIVNQYDFNFSRTWSPHFEMCSPGRGYRSYNDRFGITGR